jgi:hypothetical protein
VALGKMEQQVNSVERPQFARLSGVSVAVTAFALSLRFSSNEVGETNSERDRKQGEFNEVQSESRRKPSCPAASTSF